jgi:hypothetical protein
LIFENPSDLAYLFPECLVPQSGVDRLQELRHTSADLHVLRFNGSVKGGQRRLADDVQFLSGRLSLGKFVTSQLLDQLLDASRALGAVCEEIAPVNRPGIVCEGRNGQGRDEHGQHNSQIVHVAPCERIDAGECYAGGKNRHKTHIESNPSIPEDRLVNFSGALRLRHVNT